MNSAAQHSSLDEFCEGNALSFDQLADKLGVSRATIFNWKKDPRGLQRIVSLALLALADEIALRNLDTTASRSADESRASMDIEVFCQRNGYGNDLLSDELKVSRATIFNWKNSSRAGSMPRVALLALKALETRPELRTVKKPSVQHASRKQYRRGSLAKIESIE